MQSHQDYRRIRLLTPEEQAAKKAERQAEELAALDSFDPFARAPAGRPKKIPPAHIAPVLWADVCRVLDEEEGWGWETVRRKYQPVWPLSVRWLKRVVQDGTLEQMVAGT